MKEYILKTGQDGFSAGEAFLLKERNEETSVGNTDPQKESALFDEALKQLKAQILKAAAVETGENADIYEAENMLLEDENFTGRVRSLILTDNLSATEAIKKAGSDLSKTLEAVKSSNINQRSEDIRGLTGRLAEILSGEMVSDLPDDAVIVANELSPASLSQFDSKKLRGIITVKGSPTSHVSIMAGNLGIPYIYGLDEAVSPIRNGMRLIISGSTLILDPDVAEYEDAMKKAAELREEKKQLLHSTGNKKSKTRIYANIAGVQDIDDLLSSGAEGVGLFRTEFLFLNKDTPPKEDEQFEAYKSVAMAMGNRETIIRTMDIGSDKRAAWLDLPKEKNPALGLRGVRVSLNYDRLFRVQLRALLRAAVYGNIKIMVPMITSVWEVEEVKDLIQKCAQELDAEGIPYSIPQVGIMIETPSAVMIADELAAKSDFFSIGTNDLTQYTLALDREANGLDKYYDPAHEAVMRMIEMTIAAGHRHKIPVAICGEMAGCESVMKRLITAGIDELSVSISRVEATKAAALKAERQLNKGDGQGSFAAPADGKLIPMEDIPDKAFSSGSLGKCVGILPGNGTVYAPCDGKVAAVAETKHAITFKSHDEKTILLHAGIDTVKLGGKGFSVLVQVGDNVRSGQKVMEMDLEQIRSAGFSPMIIIVNCDG